MWRTVVLLVVLTAAPAAAQIQNRPADPPIVDAAHDAWYQRGEPVQFVGELYYPAGARVFFNGNHMVRTGHFQGVPLYADATLEPYSLVYVPIGQGLMQPYERRRAGALAGTTGSRPPSFPVRVTAASAEPPVAAVSPTAPSQPVGIARDAPSAVGTAGRDEPRAVGTAGAGGTIVRSVRPAPSTPFVTLRRPESNDGVWIQFAGEKWVSDGPAVALTPSGFMQVGEYAGVPVFAQRPLDDTVIYVPTRAGMAAPYRLKE